MIRGTPQGSGRTRARGTSQGSGAHPHVRGTISGQEHTHIQGLGPLGQGHTLWLETNSGQGHTYESGAHLRARAQRDRDARWSRAHGPGALTRARDTLTARDTHYGSGAHPMIRDTLLSVAQSRIRGTLVSGTYTRSVGHTYGSGTTPRRGHTLVRTKEHKN